jgi:hypothetical protein
MCAWHALEEHSASKEELEINLNALSALPEEYVILKPCITYLKLLHALTGKYVRQELV